MESPYREIVVRLKKIKRRVMLKNLLKNSSIAFAISTIVIIAVALMSRIVPIYGVYFIWLPCIYALGLLSAVIITTILRPNIKKVSELVDSFGLSQRVSTALELIDEENIYKQLQAEDALEKLNSLDFIKRIRILPEKKLMIACLISLLVFSCSFLIPEPLRDEANRLHALNIEKKEEIKKVEEAKKEIKENKKLTEQEQKALLEKVDALKKEIDLAKDNKEIDKSKEKMAKKLDMDKNKEAEKDLEKLAEGLKKNDATKNLAEAIKNDDKNKLENELNNLKDNIKNMDEKQKQALKNTLSSASASISSGDMKNSLDELSDSLDSGDEEAINKSVSSVKGAIGKATSQKNQNSAVASLQKSLGEEEQLAEANGQSGGGESQSNSIGQGQGSGSGQGQGNSASQGQGSGGAGAGNGSSNGSDGTSSYSGSSGIGNKAPGSSQEKEYEKVFTPSRLGGDGDTSSLSGKAGKSGSSESEITDKSNATLGELKPYDQVIGEYSNEAMENMENYQIPDGMTEIIKGYFSSLQQ